MAPKPGSLGQPIPGHVGAIVDDAGNELPTGEVGQIAFRRPDPVMLLEYWNNPVATWDKFAGDWLLTGDLGVRDEGRLFLVPQSRRRRDHTSGGYRIGRARSRRHCCAIRRFASPRDRGAGCGAPESIKAFLVSPKTNSRPTLWHRRFASSSRRGWRDTSIRATSSSSTACRTTTTGKIMRARTARAGTGEGGVGHQSKGLTGGELTCRGQPSEISRIPPSPASGNTLCNGHRLSGSAGDEPP